MENDFTIEFADDHNLIEWESEVARWLEDATGHDPYKMLLTDDSDLYDIMEHEPTGEWTTALLPGRTEEEPIEVWDVTPEAEQRAREVLLRYGVDILTEESTRLVDLAKKTYNHRHHVDDERQL
jgi:hypothetical protein